MQPDARARVWDALAAARAIATFAASTTEAGFRDSLLYRSAIERQFEILGEALGNLRRSDPESASCVPELGRIIGMRNIIAHEYGEVDEVVVWGAAVDRIPGLLQVLSQLAEAAGPEPDDPELGDPELDDPESGHSKLDDPDGRWA